MRCAAEPRNEFLGRSAAVPAKAGKDLSFIAPVPVGLNGSVLDRSFAALVMTSCSKNGRNHFKNKLMMSLT